MYEIEFNVKLADKVVKCTTFNLEDYVKFLFSRGSDNSKLIKKWSTDILKSNTDAVDLDKHDAELVLVNLIARSLNQHKIEQEYVCECGNEFKIAIDSNHATVDYPGSKLVYAFKNFKIGFKWPKLFDNDNVPDMIAKAIDAIYVGDEKIYIDELNEQELNDLYAAITVEDINYIKEMLIAPKVQLAVPVTCPKCGKSHVHVIRGFPEFIRILQ